jgi:hypothetical protein
MSVLHRPAGLDVNQPDLEVLRQPSMRREVNPGPLSERRFSGLPRSPISRSSTLVTRPGAEAGVSLQSKALARVGIDHAQDAHHPPGRQPVDE